MVDQNFYKKKRILKTIDVENRNLKRLNNTSLMDTAFELIKNAIEYGTGEIDIENTENHVKIFNGLSDEKLNQINFKKISDDLMSFKGENPEHFHEGITTYLKFHFIIRTKIYVIESSQSPDGFYQYFGESTSHYIDDETDEEIQIRDTTMVNGWEVEILNPPAEFIKIIDDICNSFYVSNDYDVVIRLNGRKMNFRHIDTTKFLSYRYGFNEQRIMYDLDIVDDDEKKDNVELFWRLDNKKVFQRINNNIFSGKNVKGRVILTDVHQFANENRIELSTSSINIIDTIITSLVKEKENEITLKKELRKFVEYREKYAEFFKDIFNIPLYKTEDAMPYDENKLENIERMSDLIRTIDNILSTCKTYKNVDTPKLFFNPTRSTRELDSDDFKNALEEIGISLDDFRRKYGKIVIGLIVIKGEVDGAMMLSQFKKYMGNRTELQLINETSLDLEELVNFNNDHPLIYPTNKYILHLIEDYDYSYIDSPEEYEPVPNAIIENIPSLSSFSVGERQVSTRPEPPILGNDDNNNDNNDNDDDNGDNENNHNDKVKFEYDGKTYYVDIIQYERGGSEGEIPFLFESEMDLYRAKLGLLKGLKITYKKYLAWQKTVELVTKSEHLEKRKYYPVFFNADNDIHAFYGTHNGVVALNTKFFPDFGDKMINATRLIEIVCHELAHQITPTHGKAHEEFYEKLLIDTKKRLDNEEGKAYLVYIIKSEL